MKLLSIQIGKSKFYDDGDKGFKSSFKKIPTDALLSVEENGIVEDSQTDKRYHGGESKAIMAFSLQSQDLYKQEFCKEFPNGIFGENLTIDGLDEKTTFIGDIYKIGEVELEVTQPREPCWKVSYFLEEKLGTKFMFQSGLTGWYLRVLKNGKISDKEKLSRIKQGDSELSIFNLNSLVNSSLEDNELLQKAINSETLGDAYKKTLRKKLEKNINNK